MKTTWEPYHIRSTISSELFVNVRGDRYSLGEFEKEEDSDKSIKNPKHDQLTISNMYSFTEDY